MTVPLDQAIARERERRQEMWAGLLAAGGPHGVQPGLLRGLGIFGGAQGVWVDKARTAPLTEARMGVTVALMHSRSFYADDLGADGLLYRYSDTHRPAARDLTEIEATKSASRLELPVFVVTQAGKGRRNVHLAQVEDWHDPSGLFLVSYDGAPSPPDNGHGEDNGHDDEALLERMQPILENLEPTPAEPGQLRFKFQVLQRYGLACAVCDMAILEILDAAHLVPRGQPAYDDPCNGLVLCVLHHRALSRGLFAINPRTLQLFFRPEGPHRWTLGVRRETILHLDHKPHPQALLWQWYRWTRNNPRW